MSIKMKNSECVIYITTKSGWTQTYHKESKHWVQVSGPKGKQHNLTAEQVLSHILPALLEDRQSEIRVEPLNGNHDTVQPSTSKV